MENQFIESIDNQLSEIDKARENKRKRAIAYRKDCIAKLLGYTNIVDEIIESANYVQARGYRFTDGCPLYDTYGYLNLMANRTQYNVGLVECNFTNATEHTFNGIGVYGQGYRLYVTPEKVMFTRFEGDFNTHQLYNVSASDETYLLTYNGQCILKRLIEGIDKFIEKYKNEISRLKYYRQF